MDSVNHGRTECKVVELLALLRALIREEIASATTVTSYTQHQRPAWAPTRLVYLRAWRALRDEGHPGVSAVGKTRLMSAAASKDWLARRSTKALHLKLVPATKPSVDEDVLAELGVRRRAGGSK